MKTLIAATDFSKTSLNAVNYAADMPAAIHARLEILHVMQVPIATGIPDYIITYEEGVFEKRDYKLQQLKKKLEKRTAHRVPIACTVYDGDTDTAIKDIAEIKKPFAIVLGSKGVTNFQNIMFGSVALHTAKHAQHPVLLIPEKAKFTVVSNIAFATDLMLESSTAIIKNLREWLKIFDARLDVINVNDNASFKTERERQFGYLKNHLSNYDVQFNYVINNSVHDGISSHIQTNKPDMLVLIYNKENFLHRLAFRSEFGNIFKNTIIPLLVIPA